MLNSNTQLESVNRFIDEVAREIGPANDRARAWRVLRAVLHTLRERLTIEESFDLIAQFPMLIKGLYVDGWNPRVQEKKLKSIDDFVTRVLELGAPTSATDFGTGVHAIGIIEAVFLVIQRQISLGEARDIESSLPKKLKDLWLGAY